MAWRFFPPVQRYLSKTHASKAPRTQRRGIQIEPLEDRHLLAADLRAIDGTGNNTANSDWGAADTQFIRLAPADFADGIDAPNGQTLPSARTISNLIANQDAGGVEQELDNNRNLSDWVYAWGQFIDHDIDLTAGGHVAMNIPVPKGDPTFDPSGQGGLQLAFNRAATAPGTGIDDPAQFTNLDTSFIDGSMIYGSDPATAAILRTGTGGTLKTSAGDLLPYNTFGLDMANPLGLPDSSLFAAGDVRANENVELSIITTLFVREHNYQAEKLAAQHPNWSDEQLYQKARQIVIGEIQAVTYNEWLPALMGQGALTSYQGYDPTVNPSVSVEFATAAFRLHTLLDDDVEFLDGNGDAMLPEMSLADDFFRPDIVALPGAVDGNLKYLSSDRAQEVDEKAVDGLRNSLFPAAPIINNVEVGASDLIAVDIQRGRDMGMPTYNAMRVAMGEAPVTSFSQITHDFRLAGVRQIYGSVDNVELFVGLFAETHLPGSSLGQTEQAILAQQFEALRDGDRYWYQNTFTGSQLLQIQHTTLSSIIERNTSITNLQSNVFVFNPVVAGFVFIDGNGNGKLGRGDLPLPGLTVQLLDGDGNVIATTRTNFLGGYSFSGLDVGSYTVQLALPAKLQSIYEPVDVDITRGQTVLANMGLSLKLPSLKPKPDAPAAPVDLASGLKPSLAPALDRS